ncbi:MAG: class I SAM-dependent rRNA methyltransferase [Truepera sp.]|nr:class I SAM-dependent rRNA methyltransferase [Truepera sp.]
MSLPTLDLGRRNEGLLRSGHPWIYRNRLPDHSPLEAGWVRLEAGRRYAIGIYEPAGEVAVRLFSRDRVPDRAWITARLNAALDLRRHLEAAGSDSYRILSGEGDGVPGLVADRYGRFAVIRYYGDGVGRLAPDIAWALGRTLPLQGVVAREAGGLRLLWGAEPPPELTVRENGLSFLANLAKGQKTGLYLDQRENRLTLSRWAAGRRVLNLFSYTGAFAIYALKGGARHAISVDSAAGAIHDAHRNAAANGFDLDRHRGITADAYDYLKAQVERGETFDLVILDPPSLARRKTQRGKALKAYRRLNALALRCVAQGGMLATSSCTAQVSPTDFREALAEAARSVGATAQLLHEAGHACDHPVPLHFPEGRYLKFILARVLHSRAAG